MCRILYIPPGQRHGRAWLAESAAQLHKSQGGDGIGWYDPAEGRACKGLGIKIEAVADQFANGREALVHFRLVSAGVRHSSLCHPFRAGKHGWLVHNGHWNDWTSIGMTIDLLRRRETILASDTLRLAQVVERLGPRALDRLAAGVLVLHGPGGPRYWKSYGSFGWGRTADGVYFASEALPGTKDWTDLGDASGISLLRKPESLPKESFTYPGGRRMISLDEWRAMKGLPGTTLGAYGFGAAGEGGEGRPTLPTAPTTAPAPQAVDPDALSPEDLADLDECDGPSLIGHAPTPPAPADYCGTGRRDVPGVLTGPVPSAFGQMFPPLPVPLIPPAPPRAVPPPTPVQQALTIRTARTQRMARNRYARITRHGWEH